MKSLTFFLAFLSAHSIYASDRIEGLGIGADVDCSASPRVTASLEYPNSKSPSYYIKFLAISESGQQTKVSLSLPKTKVVVNPQTQNVLLMTKNGQFDLGNVVAHPQTDKFCDENPHEKFGLQQAPIQSFSSIDFKFKITRKECVRQSGTVPFLDPATYVWTVDANGVLSNDKGQSITFDFPLYRSLGYTSRAECLAKNK